jgi:hypothetical protein
MKPRHRGVFYCLKLNSGLSSFWQIIHGADKPAGQRIGMGDRIGSGETP